MTNTQCPPHLEKLANQILTTYTASLLVRNKSIAFRERYFAAALALILRDEFPTEKEQTT